MKLSRHEDPPRAQDVSSTCAPAAVAGLLFGWEIACRFTWPTAFNSSVGTGSYQTHHSDRRLASPSANATGSTPDALIPLSLFPFGRNLL